MKIYSNAADPFIKDLKSQTVLIYGPDTGGVRSLEKRIIKRFLGESYDPSSLVEIDGSDFKERPGILSDEILSKSFFADKKVVRLIEPADGASEIIAEAHKQLDSSVFLIVTGGELKKDSKLRKLYEDSKTLTALLCYKEDAASLRRSLGAFFMKNQVTLGKDALEYLATNLGEDKLVTESELEKILLYLGTQKTLDVDDLMQIVADNSEMALSDVAMAISTRNPAKLEKHLSKALAESASAIGIVRAVIWHFNRMLQVKKSIESGQSADNAMAALRPAVFFKQADSFKASLAKWSSERIIKAIERLTALEKDAKSAAFDPDIICRDLFLKLAA